MHVISPLPRNRSGIILTIHDNATGYPEAIALPSTKASWIAKELVLLFSRVGISKDILTGNLSTAWHQQDPDITLSPSNRRAGREV